MDRSGVSVDEMKLKALEEELLGEAGAREAAPLEALFRLARLGLWAQQHGIPALEWFNRHPSEAVARRALATLPQEALPSEASPKEKP